jgi:hypothetical protein
MKKLLLPRAFLVVLALLAAAFAQDKADPGNSGDSVKDRAPTAPPGPAQPLRTPNEAEREPGTPGKTSDVVKPPNPAGVQREFAGSITAVSRDDRTITVNDASKVSHKLQIGDTTKMKRGEKDATWDDLKVGVRVSGTCSGDAEMAHAETININS